MVGQARRHAGQSVVVEVQLSQVGDVSQRAVLHRADLIEAQTQPAGKKSASGMRRGGVKMCRQTRNTSGETSIVTSAFMSAAKMMQ